MSGFWVGVDVVDVREVKDALARFGDRYLARIYTADEVAYAMQAPAETARRLGARFAAKEATIKALRAADDGIDPRSISVMKARDGGCELILYGAALSVARRAGVVSLAVSITHEGDIAAAVVLAERGRPGRRPRMARVGRGARRQGPSGNE